MSHVKSDSHYLCSTTCNHATIANEAGLTNRPVQELHNRTVLHRCEDGPEADDPVGVPIPPTFSTIETQHRECAMWGEGGPLQNCWFGSLESHFGILYPAFVLMLGLVAFYLLTRFVHETPEEYVALTGFSLSSSRRFVSWFPYTALMFIVGVIMGICSVVLDPADQLSSSIRMWEDIEAETLVSAIASCSACHDAEVALTPDAL